MKVSIVMPCRDTDEWRYAIHSWVIVRIRCLYPDFELCLGDPDGDFQRSQARNLAAAKATGDVLIVWDADTFCNDVFLKEALALVEQTGTWAFPYGRYYNLNETYTRDLIRKNARDEYPRPEPFEVEHDIESTGGIYVITRQAWDQIGGYDENFVDWGYEDNAFHLAGRTLVGAPSRVQKGWVSHLWHSAPESVRFNQPNIEFNRSRYRKYESAQNNEYRMRRLTEE